MEDSQHIRQIELKDLIKAYKDDSNTALIINKLKKDDAAAIYTKGLSGSLDAIIAATTYTHTKGCHVFVMHDAEEAIYFSNDLQNLLPKEDILYFPSSYKKPFELTSVENANVLQRAETLSALNEKKNKGAILVTHAAALTEKVINKKSLVENTYVARVGEDVDQSFIRELLIEYGFEPTDFVYEAGQFAIRGGIIDIYSYANELPFRIELFGDEIESIRTFDPITQLSQDEKEHAPIVPNVHNKLLQEVRESLLEFLPETTMWIKDYELLVDTIDKYFERAVETFDEILKVSGGTHIINKPEEIFETKKGFTKLLGKSHRILFGNRKGLRTAETITFDTQPQPSFNKNFHMLGEALEKQQLEGTRNIIVSDLPKQLERLQTIFEEIKPNLFVQELNLSLRGGFIDRQMNIACFTDHEIFERFHSPKGKKKYSKNKSLTLKELRELKAGDFVAHMDHGIGRFAGMEKMEINGKEQESIRLIYRDNDLLYLSLHSLHKISKYSGQEGRQPTVSKLGSPEWENKKKKARKRVKDIATELIQLYAKRRDSKGYQFDKDGYLQAELESSFIYEDTPDQARATQEVKEDMEKPYPMDRLVCGDVGFGKTEVAIRAAFKAVCDSKQVAILVPTTILAMQHYKTFLARMAELPCNIDYINRFRTTKQIKETLKKVKEGKVDILIGTHRITSKDVEFKDLGLMIIDEEQKFGVKTKEKLKEMRVNVDALTLTATPIPRTLHFSLLGARDLSVIETPPPNRQPVTTRISTLNDEIIRDAIHNELLRGGQAFFVHNRVADIEHFANKIMQLVPDAKVTYAHGQMDGPQLEKIMLRFIQGEYDVLISTNIIESGLDIPNANTIIVNQAHMFGLSDLHQMRGRVGRSNKKAYCYLLTPPTIGLSSDARKRLSTLEEFSDLGDGFKVAMRDLDIRGAGDLLGGEQSGFINDLGFDTFNQILEETVQEIKQTQFADLFKTELEAQSIKVNTVIETDFEILIPDSYVSNISERLNLYMKADKLKDEKEMEKFTKHLQDRFGPIPQPVKDLLITVKMRWVAQKLGMEKLILKNECLKAYLLEHTHAEYYQSDEFGKILMYVQTHPKICQIKETKKRLILNIEEITDINKGLELLHLLNK
ncbi:transcription-repair coupling factor [Flammeovirga kamogawensis]|uniref:Transcription-repair-coupling factor n=1 Tax=Flammeovirga kamogawensis TaxID=373891 RepID=A0ABX8GUL3_9BACT|nr:transcription-repair coupling factor [Flammeovirga kamogawensis]MBB6460110.1 transcription-repair coupling factor (superfamily II helicase) [Flammeovirga kamogawensis]QWG06847.1 transcription-repair coupling factor [Flammeovirga kamogawensis]TRX68670.1 transcription-repair coupling factor [Flammeovirga kamogawensis]